MSFKKVVFKAGVHTKGTHLSVTFSNEKIRNVKNVDFLTKFMIKIKTGDALFIFMPFQSH